MECDSQRKAITALIASQTISAVEVASKAKATRWIQSQCKVCGEICPSKRAVLHHIKSKHPGTKWPCSYCGKEYASFNGKYKHERSVHEKKKFICGVCGHGFDYKSQVDLHTPVHNPASKVYCVTCGKGFAIYRSMKRHAVIHLDLRFDCNDCDKWYNTKEKLAKHRKGCHGDGYVSLCGTFTFKWPGRCHIHQVDCDDCKEEKKKKLLRKYPSRSS